MPARDSNTLMREAHALKAAGRLEDAIQRYREALAAKPSSGVAEHNLAACLGDAGRWTEAEPHIRAAFTKGVDAPETWLLLGRCDLALGRLDAADAAYREAIRRRPDLYDAQRELAQLVWMRTGNAAETTAEIDRLLVAQPGHLPMQMLKAHALEFAGRADEAFTQVSRLAATMPNQTSLLIHAAQLATSLGRADDADRLSAMAYAQAPHELHTLLARTGALLAAGKAQQASELAAEMRRRWSTNQHAIALQATAWRMLGDDRYRELYNYDGLVAAYTLDTPTGWTSLDAYVADLAVALKDVHTFEEHPFSHSLRHGSQAVGILRRPHPALQALPSALDGPIRRHLDKLGSGNDPVRARNRGTYVFQGMWSVRLKPGGFHVDHVHQEGWLSSACYIETVSGAGHEGWIRFGQPGPPTRPPLEAEHFIKPKPGMLVLFPSYMWHGTVPFGGDKRRLTVAFDLVPGPAPDAGDA